MAPFCCSPEASPGRIVIFTIVTIINTITTNITNTITTITDTTITTIDTITILMNKNTILGLVALVLVAHREQKHKHLYNY